MFLTSNTTDLITIVVYIVLVFSVGFWYAHANKENSDDYFLAGRNMGWVLVGASLFVTNISGEHLLGLTGSGAERGMAVGSFEWLGALAMIVLGGVFVPVFFRQKIFTTSEFLEIRFNRSSRVYFSAISILVYIVTKISVALYAGGLLLRAILGWDMYSSAIFMIVIAGVYTVIGGMRAVLYTQLVQIFFLIAGAGIVAYFSLTAVGGFSGLRAGLPADYFNMFKSVDDPQFPITGILFGAPILAIWYWCTDQYIVQRVLAARNIHQAQNATIFNGFLKILPVFLWVIPGMAAAVLFPGIKGDMAYSHLITSSIVPAGLAGLVVASILAAIMSSLSSVFLSTSTLLTMDFYRMLFPRAGEQKLVLVGRLATTFVVITAILWVPLTQLSGQAIYVYLQSVQAFISPPIAAVFVFGIFSKTITSRAANIALVTGSALGIGRLLLDILNQWVVFSSPIFTFILNINFLHFAIILFLYSVFIMYVMTALGKDKGLSVRSRPFADPMGFVRSYLTRGPIVSSVLLVVFVVGLWRSFS